jgi:hypothetical protein
MDSKLKYLQTIPGVGPNVARHFWDIEIRKVSDLKGKDPERLYFEICAREGSLIDRCLLYVCRCSVYFAETKNPDPEKLKWWRWKDINPKR